MPETPEGLLARLAAAGIAAETRRHRPVFTVAESRDLRGDLPGGHTKNLFLRPAKGEGPFLLATIEGRNARSRSTRWRASQAPARSAWRAPRNSRRRSASRLAPSRPSGW